MWRETPTERERTRQGKGRDVEGDTDLQRAHWIGGGRDRLAESALGRGRGGRDVEGDTDWERAHWTREGEGIWRETPTGRGLTV